MRGLWRQTLCFCTVSAVHTTPHLHSVSKRQNSTSTKNGAQTTLAPSTGTMSVFGTFVPAPPLPATTSHYHPIIQQSATGLPANGHDSFFSSLVRIFPRSSAQSARFSSAHHPLVNSGFASALIINLFVSLTDPFNAYIYTYPDSITNSCPTSIDSYPIVPIRNFRVPT